MRGYHLHYGRLISQHVYINLYQRIRKLHFFCSHLCYRHSLVSLLLRRLQPRLFIYRSLNYSHYHYSRSRYSPWLMMSGVSCHFWNRKGINEDEIWETVNEFDLIFKSLHNQADQTAGTTSLSSDLAAKPSPKTPSVKETVTGRLSPVTGDTDPHCQTEDDDVSSDEENRSGSMNQGTNHDPDSTNKLLATKGWEAIILRDNFQVWRRTLNSNGLYQYKVFGTFTDIPAQAFFTVQRDLEYRKTWDQLVIKLEIVDKQKDFVKARKGDHLTDSGNEVVHWIMHYPFPMYSRDYCYVRRAIIDYRNNLMVLVSRAIDHPDCPVSNKYVRVSEYESQMVIKPHTNFEENGFDYMLTYFDDPRSAFPNPAYNWMAASGVPNFVESLHNAAIKLKKSNKSSRKERIKNNVDNSNHTNPNNSNNTNNENNANNDSSTSSKKRQALNNLYIQCISFNRPQQEKN